MCFNAYGDVRLGNDFKTLSFTSIPTYSISKKGLSVSVYHSLPFHGYMGQVKPRVCKSMVHTEHAKDPYGFVEKE